MGSGTSHDQGGTRVPQPPSGKPGGRKKAKDRGGPAATHGSAAKDTRAFSSVVITETPGDQKIVTAPALKSPTTTNLSAAANYANLLAQHQTQQQQQQQQQPTDQSFSTINAAPPTSGQDAELLGRKATFRQVIKRALELAQEQRIRYGKFRKDEKRAVMELYEVLGLDEDTFLAPPNELQKRILNYRFPPPNMHMLRDLDTIDEETLEYVLGPDEARLRKSEGLEVAAAPIKRVLDVEGGTRRVAVSSEVTQAVLRANPVFKNIPKSKEQGERLWKAIHGCALFRVLDSDDMKTLFNAFEMEKFDANVSIFDQGDEGDRFYLIDSGRCQVVVRDDDGREVYSVFLGEGDTFGELAIMYGTPRAATVTPVIDTVCWWIDRDTYRGMLLKETIRKREKYIKFLESVPLFQNVDAYEKARIADVLEVAEVHGKGTVIIREGDPGDTFYLIEEGEVKFETNRDGEVFERRRAGGFFGEMALLFDRPRMATVIATTPVVRLLTLNRSNFTSYLGPLDEILRRNAEQYKHYVSKAQGTTA